MEWIRPVGIVLVYFLAEYLGTDAISEFHILGPIMVIVMSGTVAFESLILGEVGSEKIGYKPNRAYQIQSGLNNLATALTALLVFMLGNGNRKMTHRGRAPGPRHTIQYMDLIVPPWRLIHRIADVICAPKNIFQIAS